MYTKETKILNCLKIHLIFSPFSDWRNLCFKKFTCDVYGHWALGEFNQSNFLPFCLMKNKSTQRWKNEKWKKIGGKKKLEAKIDSVCLSLDTMGTYIIGIYVQYTNVHVSISPNWTDVNEGVGSWDPSTAGSWIFHEEKRIRDRRKSSWRKISSAPSIVLARFSLAPILTLL